MQNKINEINDVSKRMKQLYEYSFYRNGVMEADDQSQANDEMPPSPGVEDEENNDENQPMANPQPSSQPMQEPQIGDGESNVDGANLAPNAGMDTEDIPNNDDSMQPMDSEVGDEMGDDMSNEEVGPNDVVVNISDLTNSQEAIQQQQEELSTQMDNQMSDVDQKLVTLLKVVNKFNDALNANDKKIKDLKQELIKRNPTEEEVMNVRLNAGGNPFAQKPEEFWDKFKDINNHYNITANNEAPQNQYKITKMDIDNVNDTLIDREFDEIPKTLKEYFVK